MNTENHEPFIPELTPNADKIQKLVALRELLQKVADRKDVFDGTLFNYGFSHFGPYEVHPLLDILRNDYLEVVHECGTPGCVAGWIGYLDTNHTITDTMDWVDSFNAGKEFLELTQEEAKFLFLALSYFPNEEDYYPSWCEQGYIFLNRVPISEAINRVSFLIKHNE